MLVATIAGIISHTPQVRSTRGSGERALNLDVAVRQRCKKDGHWQNETVYLDVTLFGARADGLGSILKKGSQIGATGELRVRKYIGRDKTEKTAVELIASQIWPLDWTPREERPQQPSEPTPPDLAAAQDFAQAPLDETDDIPF